MWDIGIAWFWQWKQRDLMWRKFCRKKKMLIYLSVWRTRDVSPACINVLYLIWPRYQSFKLEVQLSVTNKIKNQSFHQEFKGNGHAERSAVLVVSVAKSYSLTIIWLSVCRCRHKMDEQFILSIGETMWLDGTQHDATKNRWLTEGREGGGCRAKEHKSYCTFLWGEERNKVQIMSRSGQGRSRWWGVGKRGKNLTKLPSFIGRGLDFGVVLIIRRERNRE